MSNTLKSPSSTEVLFPNYSPTDSDGLLSWKREMF